MEEHKYMDWTPYSWSEIVRKEQYSPYHLEFESVGTYRFTQSHQLQLGEIGTLLPRIAAFPRWEHKQKCNWIYLGDELNRGTISLCLKIILSAKSLRSFSSLNLKCAVHLFVWYYALTISSVTHLRKLMFCHTAMHWPFPHLDWSDLSQCVSTTAHSCALFT